MAEPEAPKDRPQPPILASPARRILHLLIAVALWVLFTYWWFLVLGNVSRGAVKFTGLFIAATTFACILSTAIWTYHNILIWRRRGARTHVRDVKEDFSHDRLGRETTFEGGESAALAARVVLIRVDGERKIYQAFDGLAPTPGAVSDTNGHPVRPHAR